MTIQEPATLLTDWALGALSAYFCKELWKGARRGDPRRLWAWGFASLSAGAFLGGTSHGFAEALSPEFLKFLWHATLLFAHLTNFFLAAAAARGPLEGKKLEALRTFLGIKLLAAGAWSQSGGEFFPVVADSALSILVIAALEIRALQRDPKDSAAKNILLGAALSALAALVQALRLSPAPWLNHNDLYHVVQAAGVVFLYRGARGGAPRLASPGVTY